MQFACRPTADMGDSLSFLRFSGDGLSRSPVRRRGTIPSDCSGRTIDTNNKVGGQMANGGGLSAILISSAIVLVGCATAEVVPLGSDSFMISQTSAGGLFTNMGALKAEVIKRANAFAERNGKVAVPIASRETPPAPGRMPNFEYQFRLVDANDPRAPGGGLIPRADMVIENNIHQTPTPNATKPPEKDVYTELLKLDDLRKQGIITDAEFENQKAKILKK